MKMQRSKTTTRPVKKFPGVFATVITALLAFSVLPKAWSIDLFWTGDATGATPAFAGSGTWDIGITDQWSTSATSTANSSWPNSPSAVAHFLGSQGGNVTLGTHAIIAAGINFDLGASAFTIRAAGEDLVIQGPGILNNSGKTQTIIIGGVVGVSTMLFENTSTAGNVTIDNVGGSDFVGHIFRKHIDCRQRDDHQQRRYGSSANNFSKTHQLPATRRSPTAAAGRS